MFDQLGNTTNNTLAGILRLLLGLVFVMAGVLKVTVPHLGEAFKGQLAAAEIPFRELSFLTVPYVEMLAGIALLLGWQTRLSAAVASAIMLVAAHVHLAADDPALFPLQPVEPIGPLILLVGLLYMLLRGGGAWSIDLARRKEREQHRRK
jgi:putative oxidoreductase